MRKVKHVSDSGQVMLITVLVLSSITLASAVISSVLTTNQIRQSRGISNSAKAIYAADSGVEYELFRSFINPAYTFTFPADVDGFHPLTNEASFKTTVTGGSIRSLGDADPN